MEKKKTPVFVLILGILLAAALVVALIFGVKALVNKNDPAATGEPVNTGEPASTGEPVGTGDNGNTDPSATEPEDPAMTAVRAKDFYTEDEIAADDPRLDEVVAECGDYTLTNRQAQIFYGMQYVSFMSNYGAYAEYFGLDSTKPLKEQASMAEGLTWEQYFLMAAMEQFQQNAGAATAAKKANYVLPEQEQADLEDFLKSLADEGKSYGFETADAYLQDSFGSAITFADYENYLRLYFQAMSYENSIYLSVDPTDADLQAYVDEHADEFADMDMEARSIDVRHILISYDRDGDGEATDAEKAEAKTKAEELLAEYLTDPKEEHFADLANLNSEDPGSNTKGGLYEGVKEGDMVEAFNDWCFDTARQAGDTGIVETEKYGFHVMYFVGSDLSWKTEARHSIRMAHTNAFIDELATSYPCTIRYENVVLSPLPMSEASEE